MPVRDGQLGAIAFGHLGRIGLNLVPTITAPDVQPNACCCGSAECRWRAGAVVHRLRRYGSSCFST